MKASLFLSMEGNTLLSIIDLTSESISNDTSRKNLLFLSETIPSGSTWSVAGIGKSEIPLATAAIVMGGRVRVGLEDNLYMPDGSLASNSKLVETVVAIAEKVGREIANPDEARSILSLNPEHKDRILE